MNDKFAESIFHRRHVVCGIRLHPFTFAHAAALDFAGSPYASLTGAATLDDVVFALAVCRAPGAFPIQLPKVGFFKTRIIAKAVYRAGLSEAHAALMAYFDDYNCPPDMWQQKGSRAVRVPWPLYFVACLIRNGRMTQKQAWETEVGYGRWMCAALAEAGGNEIAVISDAEREAMKEAGYG